jgi:hypothetical protein
MGISVVEAVVVVETRLMRGELRLTTHPLQQHLDEQVTLAEAITVERFAAQGQQTHSDPE